MSFSMTDLSGLRRDPRISSADAVEGARPIKPTAFNPGEPMHRPDLDKGIDHSYMKPIFNEFFHK